MRKRVISYFCKENEKLYYDMNNFLFHSPTEFVFGRGVEAQVGDLVKRYGGHRVLVVYGGGHVVRCGLLETVTRALEDSDIAYVCMGGVQPNPIDKNVYAGIKLGREFGVDLLLAVGGGSVIDATKAMAAGIPYDGDFWDFFEGTKIIRGALPVGVVLTIPAAGSEGSGNSVVTQEATKRKVSLRTPYELRPKFAVMNPEQTFSLPAYQTAAGASDMIAHIQERYFTNTPHTEVTDALGESLIRLIVDVTPRVLAKPDDYDARAELMWCGTLAHNGICGTGNEEDWSSHGMEHELSAFYGVTHGAGLSVVFPAFLTYMAKHHGEKVAQWAHNVWDVPRTASVEADGLEGVKRYKAWLRSIGMPVTLKELGIDDFDLDGVNDHLHITKGVVFGAFMPIDLDRSREIYKLMY